MSEGSPNNSPRGPAAPVSGNASQSGGSQFGEDSTENKIKKSLGQVRQELEAAKTSYAEFKVDVDAKLVKARRLLVELQKQFEAEDDEEEKGSWGNKVQEQEQVIADMETEQNTRLAELTALEAAYDARAEEERDASEELRKIQKKISDLEEKQAEWEKTHPNGGEAVPQEILDKLKKNEQKFLVLSGELARNKDQERLLEEHAKEKEEHKTKEELVKLAEQLARQNEDNLLTMTTLKDHKALTEEKITALVAEKKEQEDLLDEWNTSIKEMGKLSLPEEELEELGSQLRSQIKHSEEVKANIEEDLAKQRRSAELTEMLISFRKDEMKTASDEIAQLDDDIAQTEALRAQATDEKTRQSFTEAIEKLQARKAEIVHKQNIPNERGACADCAIM